MLEAVWSPVSDQNKQIERKLKLRDTVKLPECLNKVLSCLVYLNHDALLVLSVILFIRKTKNRRKNRIPKITFYQISY